MDCHGRQLCSKICIHYFFWEQIFLDNLKTGHKRLINQKAHFIKGDINNKKLLNNIIKKYNIQTNIHLAAYLNISET